MSKRSKKPIWLLFKIWELLIISINCYVHVNCFHWEGVPHIFILCATYGGGFIIGFLNLIGMYFTDRLPVKLEALISGIIGFMCLITVYANMYVAQHDKLLAFLKDREERNYGFLKCCRNNGIISLWAAAIHFMHCSFALDMLVTHSPSMIATLSDGSQIALQSQRSKRPLKLYFISQSVETYLMNFRLFQLIFSSNVLTSDRQGSMYAYSEYDYSEISVLGQSPSETILL
ncbi:uncharacterized protein LOC117785814 [Drosophila innubila]|uniref:uncharacterized protein LOC117785814 n=1 Tax=Drosophila innubila TaxID=198719 RepID=UPI00148DDA18|nr:uncharacterized protein LOC117785814 [Drosophila innubila]